VTRPAAPRQPTTTAATDPTPDDDEPQHEEDGRRRPHLREVNPPDSATAPPSPSLTPRTARAHPSSPTPQLYLASPLTGLTADRIEALSHRLGTVKSAIVETTVGDRVPEEQWPLQLHIPFEKTRPESGDGLQPQTIYNRNLDALLDSDGLVVVADPACGAGVGQEIEWATRSGIPVLYLSPEPASRQIRGNPHGIETPPCSDAQTMSDHVRVWLRTHRGQIQGGPRRRADRNLTYLGLTTRLAAAWRDQSRPTEVAAQLNLRASDVTSLLASPARVALTPWWTICELATLLGVHLEARRTLSFAESRAWVTAATDGAWDEATADRVRTNALISEQRDLARVDSWVALHAQLFESS
jgi:hypothetical protein